MCMYSNIFLNVTCSVRVMALAFMFSWLGIWSWMTWGRSFLSLSTFLSCFQFFVSGRSLTSFPCLVWHVYWSSLFSSCWTIACFVKAGEINVNFMWSKIQFLHLYQVLPIKNMLFVRKTISMWLCFTFLLKLIITFSVINYLCNQLLFCKEIILSTCIFKKYI